MRDDGIPICRECRLPGVIGERGHENCAKLDAAREARERLIRFRIELAARKR